MPKKKIKDLTLEELKKVSEKAQDSCEHKQCEDCPFEKIRECLTLKYFKELFIKDGEQEVEVEE